ncbi:pathogenesis-related protein 1B-like [Cicer arietinum]|uniref:Pathogenesis-related protein 1B-like n=1 Tax=Cicer arietinum TaxID=3827 RepID=A0A1S2X9J7_CICAR|nr:pathogenesis-related protein 1B-like [Cicer arietinum]
MSSFSLMCVLGLIFIMGHTAHAQDSPTDYVNAHNAARSEVGVPNIVWDNTVASFAQSYANQRKDCQLMHSDGNHGGYGENIALSSGDMSGTEAVSLWVDEKANYDYNSNSCVGGECLHYTQVVWRDSHRVGCAKVKCDNGGTFITCNYSPPGNYIGQKPY